MDAKRTPDDTPVERWLRASRPQPRADFVDALERRVLPSARRAARPQRRPLFAGIAAALGTAGVVLLMALGSVGPFTDGGDNVNARDDCRLVTVKRVERVPEVVTAANGQPAIEYRKQTVSRRVRRCR